MSHPDNGPSDGRKPTGKERPDGDLLRRQRLENIGLLATRVAHDLNNMLAPMKMATPMLRKSITDPAARSLLDAVDTTVVRATELVRQILEYANDAGGQFQLVMMQQLLEEIARFAAETFPRSIRIEEHFPSDLWPINANLSQIHQVLLNLCVNARDAMPEGGVLRLRAENCLLAAAAAAAIDGGRAGAFLVLHVEDTGTGFPPGMMARLWEPFITTKKAGKGTGLGLSTVRDIIASHSGFIQLKTIPGKGSSFRIYLPAAGAPPPSNATGSSSEATKPLISSIG